MSRVASSSPSTAGKVRLAPPDHHPLPAEVGERGRGGGGGGGSFLAALLV